MWRRWHDPRGGAPGAQPVLRCRARRGAADSAAPCDLQVPSDDPATGAVPVSHRRRGLHLNFAAVPAPVRDRVTCRFAGGGAESAPPCGPPVQALRPTCPRDPGDSPGPFSRCRCRGGTASSSGSRASGGRGGHALDGAPLAGAVSTADSVSESATPNGSKTVRDNGRQPVTTSVEVSSGRVSPFDRPGTRAHRKPIRDSTIETEMTGDNRYSDDVGHQPISV